MANKKARDPDLVPSPAAPSSTAEAPDSKKAPQSGSRVKTVLKRSEPNLRAPSILPPPPFETEAEVPGLEWWLEAHMSLASSLLCLDQALDLVDAAEVHADAVRQLCRLCDSVRDALYELYCDAAHPRTADLAGFLPALEPSVRASYAWCAGAVGLLMQLGARLRSEGGPDWSEAKSAYRSVAAKRPPTDEQPGELARSLPVDFASPVEPLRNLPTNLAHLASAVAALDEALAKRFG
jgi:hypothetical protein